MELQGKVAVITGGSGGIGQAMAKAFLAEGARAVVLADLSGEAVQAAAALLASARTESHKRRRTVSAFDEQLVAAEPAARGFLTLLLEDNEPWSSAVAKGRSPNHRVNVLLRRKTALELVADLEFVLPWVNSALQPADGASRAK